jgi:hypothetical protein
LEVSAIGGALTEQLQVFSLAECLAFRTTCLKLGFLVQHSSRASLQSFTTILERRSALVYDLCEH